MNKIFQLSKLKPERLDLIKDFLDLDLLNDSVWLAGGALRTLIDFDEEVVSDYDLFFRNSEALEQTKQKLAAAGFKLLFSCPEGKLFTYLSDNNLKVQCICERFYSAPDHVILSFDFTVCQIITDGQILMIDPEMVRSIKTKVLRISSLTFPVATFKRILKYNRKGYNISRAAEDFVYDLIESRDKIWEDGSFRHYID